MKKKEIIKQAKILYKEGKTRQEVYEFLIQKIEKPISYTANILRFCPPMNTRKKHLKLYWAFLFFLLTYEFLYIIMVFSFKLKGAEFYKLFFHKGLPFTYGFAKAKAGLFSPLSLFEAELVFLIIPFCVWISALLLIFISHVKYHLNYLYFVFAYYLYSIIFYLIFWLPNFIIALLSYIDGEKFLMGDKEIKLYMTVGFINLIISIIMLMLVKNLRKKLAPFYNKEQTIYTTQKGQKRKKLVIKFND